ncbi:hypothetical protein GQ53DRAFT_836866 [Thozetella sp. PMI_491]|nr:hypothetical protein GQ53DRAFT_836866 [Thozetella sp. PMI_491]
MNTGRELTKRPRAFLACNGCKVKKSKCDGGRPVCERCVKLGIECVYSLNDRDKRLHRREGRRASRSTTDVNNPLEKHTRGHSVHGGHDSPAGETPRSRLLSAAASDMDRSDQISSAESPADAAATKIFDRLPGDTGYFGPSSNHALFRFLSATVANLGHRDIRPHQESLPPALTPADPGQGRPNAPIPGPAVPAGPGEPGALSSGLFPGRRVALELITRFFDTVGAVLPYVNEAALLKEIERAEVHAESQDASSQSLQALLSIVFAYALYTMHGASPEPFYRRALRLLHGEALHVSNLETLQALLLVGSFEQNSRRAMSSLTSHAIAVKICYQLGVHAPSSYEYLGVPEKDLRSRLWLAVVNQDRILSATLGRPCLIPPNHVRIQLPRVLVPDRHERIGNPSRSRPNKSAMYFAHLTSVYEIMGIAIETLYESNIGASSRTPLEDIIAKTLDLSFRLERWRAEAAPLSIIAPEAAVDPWPAAVFSEDRHAIVLSLYYYRTEILVHGAILLGVLEQVANSEGDRLLLQETAASLLKRDLAAVKGFHYLLSNILRQRHFLECNAVWWPCNFSALTICWHLLGFWLLSSDFTASFPSLGVDLPGLEALLRDALHNLISVGGSSMMSTKAYRCLQRYLEFLKTKSTSEHTGGPVDSPGASVLSALQWGQQFPLSGGQLLHYPASMAPELNCDDLFGNWAAHDLLHLNAAGLDFGTGDLNLPGSM